MSKELAKWIDRARAFSGTVNAGARKAAQGGKPQRTVREECGGHRTVAFGGETRAKFFAVCADLTPSSTNFDTSGAKPSRRRADMRLSRRLPPNTKHNRQMYRFTSCASVCRRERSQPSDQRQDSSTGSGFQRDRDAQAGPRAFGVVACRRAFQRRRQSPPIVGGKA